MIHKIGFMVAHQGPEIVQSLFKLGLFLAETAFELFHLALDLFL